MVERLITKELKHISEDIDIDNIGKHNVIIARNGWGKTTIIRAIRSKLFEDINRKDIRIKFSDEFIADPKGVYFTINEELDARAVRESINPNDGDTFNARFIEQITKSELSNGQDQRRTIEMFLEQLIKPNTIWFLDEPEKSLDIVQQNELIKKILKSECQTFIITHSPLFIQNDKFNKIVLDREYYSQVKTILKQG